MKHQTYIQNIQGGGYFAVCMVCGQSPFPNRRLREEAVADAKAHEQHPNG